MEPKLGLRPEVADLVILAWAALRRRAWFLHGAAIAAPKPGALRAEMELREQPMPSAAEWKTATEMAALLFGVSAGAYLTPAEVASFAEKVKVAAQDRYQPAYRLQAALEETRQRLGHVDREDSARLATARATASLADRLRQLGGVELIRALATASVPEPARAGRSLTTADAVVGVLKRFEWDRLEPLRRAAGGEGRPADRASEIVRALEAAVNDDELTQAIAPAMQRADREVFDWLRDQSRHAAAPTAGSSSADCRAKARGRRTLGPGESLEAVTADLQAFRTQNAGHPVTVEWRTE